MWNNTTRVGSFFLLFGIGLWLGMFYLTEQPILTPIDWLILAVDGLVILTGLYIFLEGVNQPRDYKLTFGVVPSIAEWDFSHFPVVSRRDGTIFAGLAVGRILSALAVTLDKLCRWETELLETKVLNFELEQHRHRIQQVQRNVQAAKNAFWRAHKLAKDFGNRVEKSYKDYLPHSGGTITG